MCSSYPTPGTPTPSPLQVVIECDKTRYRAELEFKLKPFFGGAEASNAVVGKIKLGTKTIASLEGKWDGEIQWKDESENQVGGRELMPHLLPSPCT